MEKAQQFTQNDSGIQNYIGYSKEQAEQNYRVQDNDDYDDNQQDTVPSIAQSVSLNRNLSNSNNSLINNSTLQNTNPAARLSMLMGSSYAAPPSNNLRGATQRNSSVINLPGFQSQQQQQQIIQQHQKQQYDSQIQSNQQIPYQYPGQFSQMSQSHMSVSPQQDSLLSPLLSQLPQYVPSFDTSSSGVLPPSALYQPGLLLELQASQGLMKRYKIDISEQDNTQPLEYLKQFRRQDPLARSQYATSQLSFEVLNNLQLYTEILYRAIQDKTAEHLRSSGFMRSRLTQAAKGAVQSILEYSESRTVVPKYAREGDWLCTCSNLNFAYRNFCNKCLLLKPAYSVQQASEETSDDEGESEGNEEQSFFEDDNEEENDQNQNQIEEQEKQTIVDEVENDKKSEQKEADNQDYKVDEEKQSSGNELDAEKQDNQKSNSVKSDQKTPLSEKNENNSNILGLQSASIKKKTSMEAKKQVETAKQKKSDLCKRQQIPNRSSFHDNYDENDDEYEEDEEICISSKRQLILSEMVWVCKCCRSINHCKVDACISCGMYRIINQNTLCRLAKRSQKKLAKYAQKQAEMLLKIEQSELYIAHQNLMEQQSQLAAQEQQKLMQLEQIDYDEQEDEQLGCSQVNKERLEDGKQEINKEGNCNDDERDQDKIREESTIDSIEGSQISIETSSERSKLQQKVGLEGGRKDKHKLDSKHENYTSDNENINSSNNSEICAKQVGIEDEKGQQSQASTIIFRNPLEDIGDTSSNEILSESEQSNSTPIEGKQGRDTNKQIRGFKGTIQMKVHQEEYCNTLIPYPEEQLWE